MPASDHLFVRQLPNALTLLRLALVPVFVVLFVRAEQTTPLLGALFVGAAFTDFLDGMIARRLGVLSQFGKVADPMADRLLVNSAVILLCIFDPRMAGHEWVVVVLRDAAGMYGILRLRHYAIVDVSRAGKLGTALMMVGLAGLLVFRTQEGWYWPFIIGLAMSVFTLAAYVWRYRWVFAADPEAAAARLGQGVAYRSGAARAGAAPHRGGAAADAPRPLGSAPVEGVCSSAPAPARGSDARGEDIGGSAS